MGKKNQNKNIENNDGIDDLEMEIRIDGDLMIHVKHLQLKFRGNELIHFKKVKIEVYWDVHDWLFSPGLRHAFSIIKPLSPLATSSSPSHERFVVWLKGLIQFVHLSFASFSMLGKFSSTKCFKLFQVLSFSSLLVTKYIVFKLFTFIIRLGAFKNHKQIKLLYLIVI